MSWAVIGSAGLLGQDLLAFLKQQGEDVNGFHRGNLDLSVDPNQMVPKLREFDVWVNCVGYTKVDKAESQSHKANLANGVYAGAMARAAALVGARFVQISTDYVFDGLSKTPYTTTASTDPKTSYGKSKALGEKLVAESRADYSILRTAWLYGAHGACFPKLVADSLRANGTARIVGDQIGQPTWSRDLAEKIFDVASLAVMPRIIHAVSSGQATWADFAKEVAKSIGISDDSVEEISSTEYPTPAKRPAWSVLDNSNEFLTPIGDWRERWHEAAPEVLRGI